MSATAKPFGLSGAAHTAGIFADHSVDGPIIGTLVAVVDRAKNLPNRKTIGKQDPYCAARLGKEAKKTATDIRGGQTPKWDQELRFTVHDSSDYYQLKVSVFTDDKRTDLIGETWIDLKGIIIAGGGQSDVWQSLSCKGKYAGEIRLEITFYDSRPKPERPAAARPKQQHAETDTSSSRQRGGAKRRPLPSDPVTGEVPPMAAAVSASTPDFYAQQQTPPRQHTKRPSHPGMVPNQSPLQSVEYNAASSRSQPNDPYYTTPTRRAEREQSQDWDQYEYEPPGYDQPSQRHYSPAERHDASSRGSPRHLPPIETAPPPPPAHRSRQSSVGPEVSARGSFETSPQKQTGQGNMRHGVLRNEAHRYTSSTSNLPYQTYQAPAPASAHSPNSPRHHERAPSHDPYARNGYGGDEMHFDGEPSPGPYSRSPGHAAPSPRHYTPRYDEHAEFQNAPSPMASREFGTSPGRAPQDQHQHHRRPSYREEYEPSRGHSPGYGVPPPPSSLSYNVDPRLSRDVADRINDERRYDERLHQQSAAGRGRQYSEPPPSYGGRRDASPQPMQQSDRRSTANFAATTDPHAEQRRRMSASPNPAHRIPRKSVSPAPSLVVVERRRLSDVPFGPDSYDALNPSAVSSAHSDYSATSGLEHRQPNGKIIAHNGQEVDPSDHLPETSWAPEPEPRPGSKQPSPEPTRTRQSLSGAQPMPQAPRNRDHRSTRPEAGDAHQSYSYQYNEPTTPTATGRTKLQKKARGSSMSPGAIPLAPMAPEQYHDNRYGGYSPSREPARGHYDYPNENYAPQYGQGPPVPAKVPLYQGEHSALADEMSRIDIGNGRSRRRGGY